MSCARRIIALLFLGVTVLISGGCAEFFDGIALSTFEESDDPELRGTGEYLGDIEEEQQTADLVNEFLATGDPSHLARTRALRPHDAFVAGFEVVLATLDGTPEDIEIAKRRLIEAEARRLAATSGSESFTPRNINGNAITKILDAQMRMLGGWYSSPWSPPGPDADERTHRLYADYCATRRTHDEYFPGWGIAVNPARPPC